jgi:hypothetical protein
VVLKNPDNHNISTWTHSCAYCQSHSVPISIVPDVGRARGQWVAGGGRRLPVDQHPPVCRIRRCLLLARGQLLPVEAAWVALSLPCIRSMLKRWPSPSIGRVDRRPDRDHG